MISKANSNFVIVGNGVAGFTAALRLRELRPDARITMVSAESTYPFSRPALMYVFLGHMRYQDTKPYEDHVWREARIDLVRDWVRRVDTSSRSIEFTSRSAQPYDQLLLALGSKPNKFGWPGQGLRGVQGFYSLADLKRLYGAIPRTSRAVIVGGGLIGLELAEMLLARSVRVTMLVRETSYWNNVLPAEESAMVSRIIEHSGIELRLSTQLKEVIDDGAGNVAAVVTDSDERIECQLVGLTVGVSPNVDLAKVSKIPVRRGVLVDATLRSRVDGVWAAGDCAEWTDDAAADRGTIQQVWYTGKTQGGVAACGMAGSPTKYDPGVWYNSAKFLDVEYQTYGSVQRNLPGERNLYWEHPTEFKAIRIVHKDERVIGFNVMGVRFRHEVCERWIRERATLREVLSHIRDANFDPEFSARHEVVAARSFAGARS